MGALTIALALLVVVGAAGSALLPGVRPASLALAATSVLVGLLALALGSWAVFLVESAGTLLVVGLVQVLSIRDERRAPLPAVRTVIAPAGLAVAVLVALGWAAVQPGWPSGRGSLGHDVVRLLGRDQLVPLIAAAVLVITAGMAVLTLREPRAAQRPQASPPRRQARPERRPPRSRGRR